MDEQDCDMRRHNRELHGRYEGYLESLVRQVGRYRGKDWLTSSLVCFVSFSV